MERARLLLLVVTATGQDFESILIETVDQTVLGRNASAVFARLPQKLLRLPDTAHQAIAMNIGNKSFDLLQRFPVVLRPLTYSHE